MSQPGMQAMAAGTGAPTSAVGSDAEPLVQRLDQRLQWAQQRRTLYENTWQEIYDFVFPQRPGFQASVEGQRRDQHIYDDTAIVSTEEFANRMQDGLMPSQQDWAVWRPIAEKAMKDNERMEALRQLDEAKDRVFQELRASNLYEVAGESFRDLALGSALLRFDDTPDGFRFHTVPQNACWWLTDAHGQVTDVFDIKMMAMEEVARLYGAQMIKPEDQGKLGTMEATRPTEPIVCCQSLNPAIGMADPTWSYVVYNRNSGMTALKLQLAGHGSQPFIPHRWSVLPGEIYGRGPLYTALGSIKVVNLVVQLLLENADLQIGGVWQMEDDGVVNVDTLQLHVGKIVGYAAGTKGLTALTPPGRFDMSQIVLQDLRYNIKKALFAETLGPRAGTPPSATEVAERMAELSRQMGAVLDRLQGELLRPILTRSLRILAGRGELELPRFKGRGVRIEFLSPLIRQRDADQIQRFARFTEQVGAQFGPQSAKLLIKEEDAIRWLAEKWGIPLKLVRTQAEQTILARGLGQAVARAGMPAAPGAPPEGIPVEAVQQLTGSLGRQ